MKKKINIIGAGLSGCELALLLDKVDIFEINLYEMRPKTKTNAHKTNKPCELVCSNSFRSVNKYKAAGLLKEEMSFINSPLLEIAKNNSLAGGDSLVVDRNKFQKEVNEKIKNSKNIKVVHEEVETINIKNGEIYVVATGPLTSDTFFKHLNVLLENNNFSFFDGTAPIINSDSINYKKCYFKNRFDKGEGDIYLNCPLDKEEYNIFYNKLLNYSKTSKLTKDNTFKGCLPIEEMALSGIDTLRFGPMKPVGLDSDKKHYAVVQLRADNYYKDMYNIVGFQTGLKEPEQKDLISTIPGLEKATFYKYGRLHESKYINSPSILTNNFKTKKYNNLYIVGQLTGIEGYIESIATSDVVYLDLYYKYILNKELTLNSETVIGALEGYAKNTKTKYLPMKSNFGILKPLGFNVKKKEKKELIYQRSISNMEKIKNDIRK